MSVKIEASGRRSIQVEVEVPGTPEQVWRAIATGPGVSCWFVPADVEEREGGKFTFHWGPGIESSATISAWDPPRRCAAESEGLAPGSPPLATEWIVEARSGGTCVVRVVHSLFASSDDWDDQLEQVESGWPGFFRILRLYLTHFDGQRCANVQLMGAGPGSETQAWDALLGALGLAGAASGQPWHAPAGAPPLAGTVEERDDGKNRHVTLRLDERAPGVAFVNAYTAGGQAFVGISFYLYGDAGAAAATRDQPAWQAWMREHFPQAPSV